MTDDGPKREDKRGIKSPDYTEGAASPAAAVTPAAAIVERAAALLLFIGLMAGIMLILWPFATAILFGAVMAISLWPLRNALVRRGVRPGTAAIAMLIGTLLLLGVPSLALTPRLVASLTQGAQEVQGLLAALSAEPPAWVAELPFAGERLAASWRRLATGGGDIQAIVRPVAEFLGRSVLATVGALADSLLTLLLSLIVASMLWANGDVIAAILRQGAGRLGGPAATNALEVAGMSLRSVAYGVVGTAVVQGILMAVGAGIAGVPIAMLLGFVVMLLSLSQIGSVLIPAVWGGASWWLFRQDAENWGIFVLAWGLILVSGSDNVLRPWLISRGVAMPMTLVVLGVFGGFLSFGFLGLFVGPALMAVAFTLLRAWVGQAMPASGASR